MGGGFKKRVEKEMRPWWDEKRVVLQKKKDQRKGVSLAGARMKRALIEKEQCSRMTLHKKKCIAGQASEKANIPSEKLFFKTHSVISFHSNHVTCMNATKVGAEET